LLCLSVDGELQKIIGVLVISLGDIPEAQQDVFASSVGSQDVCDAVNGIRLSSTKQRPTKNDPPKKLISATLSKVLAIPGAPLTPHSKLHFKGEGKARAGFLVRSPFSFTSWSL